jgi:hypothetical protein
VIVASSACARLAAFDTRTDSSLQESFHREVKAFDPTNLSIQGITGHHHPDCRADKHQINGTIQHQLDGSTSTHNPWVAGSIPARPTNSQWSVSRPDGVARNTPLRWRRVHPADGAGNARAVTRRVGADCRGGDIHELRADTALATFKWFVQRGR